MSLADFLTNYGYMAVFAGSLLEGESLLILAGFAAQQGYLPLAWVVVVAFWGATLGDQIFFFTGRRWGEALLRRLPWTQSRAQRVNRLLLRYYGAVIIGVRFMYGFRIIGPIVIGMGSLSPWRFMTFNLIGAAIWSVTISGAGFLFGKSLQLMLGNVEHYEGLGALLLVSIAALVGVVHLVRLRKK
jgi:membrane protein DedA with SNARE-associated domain